MPATVTALFIHPVKSLGKISLTRCEIDERGLKWDRRWMVVDPDGKFITQRQVPAMATLTLAPLDDRDTFSLTASSGQSVVFSPADHDGTTIMGTVWKSTLPVRPAGHHVDEFLTHHLGLPCRLVYMGDAIRQVDPGYAEPGRLTSLSDGYPILLANEASLADLNGRMPQGVPMDRFRPNIVIKGADAFSEDGWGTVRIGTALLQAVKPCSRCIVTTIDQDTGEKTGKEPLKTLAAYRNSPGGVLFGENLIVIQPGEVRVGDTVEHVAPRERLPRADHARTQSLNP